MKHRLSRFLLLVQIAFFAFGNYSLASSSFETVDPVRLGVNTEIPFFNTSNLVIGSDTTKYSQLDIDQIADSLTQKVIRDNKIVDLLNPDKVYTLPIGIGKQIGGVYYIVVLDELRFTTTGLTAKAYMSLSFPGSSKKIGLVADDVKISVDGIQAAKLKMLKDKPLELSGDNTLLINADSTFIEWDCNGYKDIQLSAKLLLDPSVFYKENPSTRSVITGEQVTGKILCTVADLNDILIKVSVNPFQVKNLPGFSFYPKQVVLDMSDTRNDESMKFPTGYESALFDGSNKNLWRGLFINSFTLKFPKKFAKTGPPPEVTVSNFLLDFEGITGSFALNYPLLTLEQGNLGGWNFSVNSISFSLIKNELSGFGLSGGILLPVTEKNKPLNYKASIDGDRNFLFQVTLPGNLNVPLFGSGSKLTIDSNSKITVVSKDGEFYPKAELNGKLKIQVGGAVNASLADIDFQGFVIQRESPQLDIKYLSMTSGAMAGFPVQVKKISLERNSNDVGLLCDVVADLMENKINGETSFVVWATSKESSWEYKDFELRKIKVDANTGPIKLKGALVNYKNDQTYGNGYYGLVDMSVTPGITVEATAQFGSVNGLRFWFADASMRLSSGIPVFAGFGIYGFGGGAYYHMQRNVPTDVILSNTSNAGNLEKATPGKTESGITYTPNKDVNLGINAKTIIGTQPSPDAFNGSVEFGVEFTSSFGISKVFFEGNGRFMTDVTSSGSNSKVKATVEIQYLVEKKELSGYADAFINVAGAIKGSGKDNCAGRVDFYFAESKWHIYIGTPTSPVGVKLMNTVSATSYFMVGTELPDFPSLPANLSELSGKVNFTNMRSESLTRTGGGFAFGASANASTGEKHFLIFYGKFQLGAGFDFMLKNFGDQSQCEGSNGPLGIDGWYAQGQAWAYVDARIGVKVKVLGTTHRFTIIDAGFAAVLGAQLPNPTYLEGAVEAHFSVLGGLVSGKCHFEFSYGNECKLVNANEVEGIKVLGALTPAEGGKKVDVFVNPQVAFNIPVNKSFNILDEDGNKKSFRVVLDYFKIVDNGSEVISTQEWNATNDVLALKPFEILPGQKTFKAMVKVHFQKSTREGNWEDYTVAGNVEGEEGVVSFTTGDAPENITENNVKYTYPARSMVNFLKQEYGKSYIQLNQGIDYLFTKEGNWAYIARFTSGETILNMPVTYITSARRVELDVPANLVNSTIYKMQIMRVPVGSKSKVVDKNLVLKKEALSDDQELTTKDLSGVITDDGSTELYSLYFRTSKFNSFLEKINSFKTEMSQRYITDGIYQLALFLYNSEPFDKWDMDNVQVEAILDDNYWYNTFYKDLIYSNYPIKSDVIIDWRKLPGVGMPPVLIGKIYQAANAISLTENDITSGSFAFDQSIVPRIEYNLNYYVSQDFCDLRVKSFQYVSIPALNRIVNFIFRGLTSDKDYYFKVKYVVPGNTTPTSEYKTYIRYI